MANNSPKTNIPKDNDHDSNGSNLGNINYSINEKLQCSRLRN